MVLIIAVVIVVIACISLISNKNTFVFYSSEVERLKSEVNTAKAKYLAVQKKAIGLAGMATKNESTQYQNIKTAGGTISSDQLLYLGQQFPDLKDKFAQAASLSEKMYTDYRNAQSELNNAITRYNRVISMFPKSISAYILGYVKEDLIDQENLENSKVLDVDNEINFDEFLS